MKVTSVNTSAVMRCFNEQLLICLGVICFLAHMLYLFCCRDFRKDVSYFLFMVFIDILILTFTIV